MVEHQTPEREVGFDPHSGHHVVSLSKIHLPPNKKLAASKAYSIPPAMCRSKPCKFVKNYFSALNFFMHIYDMSVTYLPSIK